MSDLLNVRKRVTEVETKYYMHQLVNSLQYLHKHLVIHRDLKLGNLFLDADMRIKVGDFGLAAKLESPDERRMTVCGTPNYIAPELLEGKKGHSFEVDIWSTGVIMYTLLVGKPPYQSKDVKSTYKRILANAYSYPDNLTISMEAKSLISKMLQVSFVSILLNSNHLKVSTQSLTVTT
jgi:polo-like kinase 1